jgi:hypothetical protein
MAPKSWGGRHGRLMTRSCDVGYISSCCVAPCAARVLRCQWGRRGRAGADQARCCIAQWSANTIHGLKGFRSVPFRSTSGGGSLLNSARRGMAPRAARWLHARRGQRDCTGSNLAACSRFSARLPRAACTSSAVAFICNPAGDPRPSSCTSSNDDGPEALIFNTQICNRFQHGTIWYCACPMHARTRGWGGHA